MQQTLCHIQDGETCETDFCGHGTGQPGKRHLRQLQAIYKPSHLSLLLAGFDDHCSKPHEPISDFYFFRLYSGLRTRNTGRLSRTQTRDESTAASWPWPHVEPQRRSGVIARACLRVLLRSHQTRLEFESLLGGDLDRRILPEIRRGSWIGHYQRAEANEGDLVGLLGRYLRNWEHHGLHEQLELKVENGQDFTFFRSPLHFCAAFGLLGLGRVYLQMGHNVNLLAQPGGQSALHLAAGGGHPAMVKMLLDRGADIEMKTAMTERTPLQIAAFRGRLEVVRLLLERGVLSDARDIHGMTAYDLASTNGYHQIADLCCQCKSGALQSINEAAVASPHLCHALNIPFRGRASTRQASPSATTDYQTREPARQNSSCCSLIQDSGFFSLSFCQNSRLTPPGEPSSLSNSDVCVSCGHEDTVNRTSCDCGNGPSSEQEDENDWVEVSSDSDGEIITAPN